MKRPPKTSVPATDLRRRAEARMQRHPAKNGARLEVAAAAEDPRRLLHELQVHQVELEMQNGELLASRDRTEALLEKFTDLYDFAPVGYFTLDQMGRIVEANLTGATTLGFERSRLMRRRLLPFVDAASRPTFLRFLERSFEGEENNVCEVPLAKPDGTRLWARLHGTVALPFDGSPRLCQVAISDITHSKQAEEALRRNEALFSELIGQSPVGVYVVDSALRLQQVNTTAMPVFKNIPELIGREFIEILRVLWPAKLAAQIFEHFRHTLDTGQPYLCTAFSERRNDTGMMEAYEWQLRRITMPTVGYGVVCFFSDVTERLQAETMRLRLEVMTASNEKLEVEIERRRKVENDLRKSELRQDRLLRESRVLQGQLRLLSRQVIKAQEDERKRVSRDLHDVIAQTMTGIGLRLANLKAGSTGKSASAFGRELAQTQRLVLRSVDFIQEFARDLRPTVLDDLGLVPALHTFMKSFAARTGLSTSLTAFAAVEKIDIARRTALFRVAQEALTNVARHAHATRVDVIIAKTAGGLCMTVKDNGRSFSAEHALKSEGGQHLGLLGMRERLETVGGTLSIGSASGKGTAVTAELPIRKARNGQTPTTRPTKITVQKP
jgi:PAS domain S-box-containing protein